MAIPAFTIACLGLVFIQLLNLFGCLFYSFSMNLLKKWNNDNNFCTQGAISKAYLKRVLKSLPSISFPAVMVGIIDSEIKMNYMDNLLQTAVNTVLTLKDIIKWKLVHSLNI